MKNVLVGATLALMAGAGPVFAEMTDIRFTLGWKTQGSDAPFLLRRDCSGVAVASKRRRIS